MSLKFPREHLSIAVIFLLLLGIVFCDIIFLGKTFKVSTTVSQALPYGPYGQRDNKLAYIPVNGQDGAVLEEPNLEFVKNSLKKGVLPLWNPYQGCGYAFIGMIEMGIFFPLTFILYVLPQLFAWDVMILSRFFFAGFFTYWLMRTLGYKKIPSLGAGIIFMLSGPMVMLQYWFANVDIIAPLLLICLERLMRKTTIRNAGWVAVSIGLTIFGGHPEHIFFVNLFSLIFFGFRIWTQKIAVDRKRVFGYLCLAYALGIGLGCVILFPFVRNFLFEFWHAHPKGMGLSTGEVKNRIITLILPYFFQKESLTYDFTFAGWWGGYIGILPFALASLSLWTKQKNGLNYFLAALVFVIIGKCYAFFLVNWLGYLPLLNASRFYVHTTHYLALFIAILGGMGINVLLTKEHLFRKGLIFSLLIAVLTALYLFYFHSAPHFSISLKASLLALGILAVFQWILLAKDKHWLKPKHLAIFLVCFVAFELSLYIPRERARRFDSFPKVPYIDFIKNLPEHTRVYGLIGALYPNTASAYQVDDLGIFVSLLPKRFVHFVNHFIVEDCFKQNLSVPALRSRPVDILLLNNPFVDLLNVEYFIYPVSRHLMINAPKPVYAGEVNVYKKKSAFKRTFIVHRAVFFPPNDKNDIFAALADIRHKLREIILVEHAPVADIEAALKDTPVTDNSSARIAAYSQNEVIIDADLEHAGFVVLSDAYHPDWKAFVDGKETKVFATDYLIRSVFVLRGRHEVRFLFQPMSFYWGAALSFIALIVVMIIFIKSGREKYF